MTDITGAIHELTNSVAEWTNDSVKEIVLGETAWFCFIDEIIPKFRFSDAPIEFPIYRLELSTNFGVIDISLDPKAIERIEGKLMKVVKVKCVTCGMKKRIKPGQIGFGDHPMCPKCLSPMVPVKAESK